MKSLFITPIGIFHLTGQSVLGIRKQLPSIARLFIAGVYFVCIDISIRNRLFRGRNGRSGLCYLDMYFANEIVISPIGEQKKARDRMAVCLWGVKKFWTMSVIRSYLTRSLWIRQWKWIANCCQPQFFSRVYWMRLRYE